MTEPVAFLRIDGGPIIQLLQEPRKRPESFLATVLATIGFVALSGVLCAILAVL